MRTVLIFLASILAAAGVGSLVGRYLGGSWPFVLLALALGYGVGSVGYRLAKYLDKRDAEKAG